MGISLRSLWLKFSNNLNLLVKNFVHGLTRDISAVPAAREQSLAMAALAHCGRGHWVVCLTRVRGVERICLALGIWCSLSPGFPRPPRDWYRLWKKFDWYRLWKKSSFTKCSALAWFKEDSHLALSSDTSDMYLPNNIKTVFSFPARNILLLWISKYAYSSFKMSVKQSSEKWGGVFPCGMPLSWLPDFKGTFIYSYVQELQLCCLFILNVL